MICADAAIPEVARNLAFNGAEIILNPLCQGIFMGGLRHRVPVAKCERWRTSATWWP